MNFTRAYSFLASLLVVFLFSSCQKDFNHPTTNTQNDQILERGNDSNPYDQIGSLHNQGLDFIFAEESYLADPNISQDEKKTFLISQTEAFLGDVNLYGNTYSGDEGYDWYSIFDANLEDTDAAVDGNEYLNDNEKDFMKQYFNTIKTMDPSTEDGLNSLVSYTESMEYAITDNPEFENAYIMFSTTSVSKHSAQYWSGSSDSDGATLQRWLLADAMGAMYGAGGGVIGMLGFGIVGSALSYAHDKGYID